MKGLFCAFCCALMGVATLAQQDGANKNPQPWARNADVYCTGFISEQPPRDTIQVVGSEKEYIKEVFSQGDVVYLNRGWADGIQPGAVYYVLRPLGPFRHPFTKKKLGYFSRELGLVRVIQVHDKTSTAEVIVSCDTIMLGDILRPYEEHKVPQVSELWPLPRYEDGNGGARGRIIMAPDLREFLSANQIVYIDLGYRHGIRPGDHFIIYRAVGKGEGIAKTPDYEVLKRREPDFGSDRYRGGEFASDAPRIPVSEVYRHRPPLPRKVLGELVVLRVEGKTSVALITRTTGEVNIGDFVERWR